MQVFAGMFVHPVVVPAPALLHLSRALSEGPKVRLITHPSL